MVFGLYVVWFSYQRFAFARRGREGVQLEAVQKIGVLARHVEGYGEGQKDCATDGYGGFYV
jgi:hypothetical protein